MVGVTRFELVASWTRTMHATKLRYTPALTAFIASTLIIIAHIGVFVNPF